VPDRVIRQKVLCYIVRDGQLLVFRHLGQPWDASGLQVPAGSIRPGESPEAAALREAEEETGLTGLQLVRKLGEVRYDLAPYRPEIQHRHVFELRLQDEPPERWVSRETDPETGGEQPAFECYWIPLAQGHVLSGGQGALLGLLESG
jgi:8-oxo-dGTP pyrophosphatase MutT (NUDIX family)